MKRTISARALEVVLVSLFLTVPCQAEQKPGKVWKGMGPINDKYDWLRPPDEVLLAALTRVHSGAVRSEDLVYKYRKAIQVSALRRIWEIWLHTPTTSAAHVAATNRLHFLDKPTIGEVRSFVSELLVTVIVQSSTQDDFPTVAIMKDNAAIRRSSEEPPRFGSIACWDYEELSCWNITKHFSFRFDEHQRISGSGHLVLRWNDFEKQIPLNFDYLW